MQIIAKPNQKCQHLKYENQTTNICNNNELKKVYAIVYV